MSSFAAEAAAPRVEERGSSARCVACCSRHRGRGPWARLRREGVGGGVTPVQKRLSTFTPERRGEVALAAAEVEPGAGVLGFGSEEGALPIGLS
jgi:hypothetical protein